MSLHQRVINRLTAVGGVIFDSPKDPLTRNNPARISLYEEFATDMPVVVEAWIYERVTGAEVLRIDVTAKYVKIHDYAKLVEKVRNDRRNMPYGRIELKQIFSDVARVRVTHSMHAADTSSDGLIEVMHGMIWSFNEVVEWADDINFEYAKRSGDEPSVPPKNDVDHTIVPVAAVSDAPRTDDSPDIDSEPDDLVGPAVSVVPAADTIESVMAELEALVGLDSVKALVARLTAQQRVARRRKEQGLVPVVPSPHLVFTGNPGTGKTTVARLIGRLYKALGLLDSGHLIEADRASLVGGYIGQTALKTLEVCNSALNGVLFIDEAYTLAGGYQKDYGHEAIATLLTFMENNRGRFALVVAGYEGKMGEFLAANPGLRSRFDVTIDFPDYDDSELMEIFTDLVTRHDYLMEGAAKVALMDVIRSLPRGEGFGNAREMRRLFNTVVANHAVLLDGTGLSKVGCLNLITEEAIPAPVPTAPRTTTLSRSRNVGYL